MGLQRLVLANNRLTAVPGGMPASLKVRPLGPAWACLGPVWGLRGACVGPAWGAEQRVCSSLSPPPPPPSPSPLTSFPHPTPMQILILTGNPLGSLAPGAFAGLACLQRLELGGSGLASIPPGVLGGLRALEVLVLSGNRLAALPDDLGGSAYEGGGGGGGRCPTIWGCRMKGWKKWRRWCGRGAGGDGLLQGAGRRRVRPAKLRKGGTVRGTGADRTTSPAPHASINPGDCESLEEVAAGDNFIATVPPSLGRLKASLRKGGGGGSGLTPGLP